MAEVVLRPNLLEINGLSDQQTNCHGSSEPTQTPMVSTLQPPKRHAHDWGPQASLKRLRLSPGRSDVDCSSPGSSGQWTLTSNTGSPFPSLEGHSAKEDDTGGLGEEAGPMDWEQSEEAGRDICYGAVSKTFTCSLTSAY